MIGTGATCKVHRGEALVKGEKLNVAVKVFNVECDSKTLNKEYKMLRSLSHENIVQLYSYLPRESMIIMELCFIKYENNFVYDMRKWPKVCTERTQAGDYDIFKQVLSGIEYLHGKGVVHSDVKPGNMLVEGNFSSPHVKLADFGLAYSDMTMTAVTQHSTNATAFGTLMYQGPECANPEVEWRTKKNDIYAFAFSCVEILFPERKTPYGSLIKGEANQFSLIRLKMKSTKPPLDTAPNYYIDEVWDGLKNVLDECLDSDPIVRPAAGRVLALVENLVTLICPEKDKVESCESDYIDIEMCLNTSATSSLTVTQCTTPSESQEDISVSVSDNEISFPANPLQSIFNITSNDFEIEIIDLLVSQNTALETISLIQSESKIQSIQCEAYQTFVSECRSNLQHPDVSAENAVEFLCRRYDASNSCVWLAVDICMKILNVKNLEDMSVLAEKVRNLIFEGPKVYNEARNLEKHYSPEEVILMLDCNVAASANTIIGENVQDLKNQIENTLKITTSDLENDTDTVKIVYICQPLAFALALQKKQMVFIDTHPVPPSTSNGMIVHLSGEDQDSLLKAMADTIVRRLQISLHDKLFGNYSTITVLTAESEISLQISDEDAEEHSTATNEDETYSLKGYQTEVMGKVLKEKKDVIMFWGTGAGKTFTVMRIIEKIEHSAVIVVPTLALMLDIAKELRKKKTNYMMFSSLQTRTTNETMTLCLEQKSKVLLVTPEAVVKFAEFDFFNYFNEKVGIDLIVTEEAHCDFLWESFRSKIKESKKVFSSLSNATRIAITASPPAGNTNHLADVCGLREDYFLSKQNLYRKDLKIHVYQQAKLNSLIHKEDKTIIFCHMIDTVHKVADDLDEGGYQVVCFTGGNEMSNEARVDNQAHFDGSNSGVLVATKSQAFGVNYSNVTKVVIYDMPDSMEILYQMLGRASREGNNGDIFILYNRQTMALHSGHLKRSLDNKLITKETADILSDSLLAMQMLSESNKCRWGSFLEYFNAVPDHEFRCEVNCDNCVSDVEDREITELAKPILEFILSCHSITRSKLIYLLLGNNSEIEKVDVVTQTKAKNSNVIHLGKALGMNRADVTSTVDEMIGSGLLVYNNKVVPGQRSARLVITSMGQKAIFLETITVTLKKHKAFAKKIVGKKILIKDTSCHLPTESDLEALPSKERSYELPENLEEILRKDVIGDELLEVALQSPVARGNIVLDFEDENGHMCVPKDVIDSLYCKIHKKIKPGWADMLTGFHRFPRRISWREGSKWIGTNSFGGRQDYIGINFSFTCANKKDGCLAQYTWKSTGLFTHHSGAHIMFETVFKTKKPEEEDTVSQYVCNRHIHTFTQPPASKHFAIDNCCIINQDILPNQFQRITIKKTIAPKQTDAANPIRASMNSNLQAMEDDPYAVQVGTTLTTYNRMRNIAQNDQQERTPWLKGVDKTTVTMTQRILHLKKFIDDYYWKKEKQDGTYSDKKKYTYFIESVTESTQGITVLVTCLLGIKLYSLIADRAVISIDGTGRGHDDKGSIMQYCITGDVGNHFHRSDKTKLGVYPLFELWLIGPGTTNIPNIESGLKAFQTVVTLVCNRWIAPKYVKLDGERALIQASKVFGRDTRRLVEKNHANRLLEYNLCINGPLKNDGKEQAIFLKLWEKFCDSNSMLAADLVRSEIKKRYKDTEGYDTMMN